MAWIAAAATVASAFMQQQGQKDANDTNRQIQENNSAFNAEQAALNRQWQHDETQQTQAYNLAMSSTAWQRGVADLRAAGMNPMLGYAQGPASAPQSSAQGGSMAQAGGPGNQQNVWAAAGQTAMQWAQIGNIEAQTEKTNAEREVIESELFDEKGQRKGKWDSLTAAQKNALTGQINHQALLLIEQKNLTKEQTALAKEQIQNAIKEGMRIDADTALKKVNEVLQRYDIPRMKAEDAYFRTPVGKTSPHNKYGPQTPFRLLEGLGERLLNRSSANPGANDLERDARRSYGR